MCARDKANGRASITGRKRPTPKNSFKRNPDAHYSESDQRRANRPWTDARLVKGDGYFYFDSGEAENWLDKTVTVPTLRSQTVEEWVQVYHKLKQLNRGLLQ